MPKRKNMIHLCLKAALLTTIAILLYVSIQIYPDFFLPKLKPESTRCYKDPEKSLAIMRQTQARLIAEWNEMQIDDKIKWLAIGGLYETAQIPFKLLNSFVSDNENKYFLSFVDRNAPCNVITLGVGMDFSGEAEFWRRYPQCKLTAVDPISEINKELVEQIPNARFFQAAISSKDEKHNAHIKQTNLKYRDEVIQHVGMIEFLEKINGNKTVDLMNVDVEGAEYELMPLFIDEKDRLPLICQINMEIHYSPKNIGYDFKDAFDRIHTFLSGKVYAIFHVEILRLQIRAFFVNTVSEECRKKLFCVKTK